MLTFPLNLFFFFLFSFSSCFTSKIIRLDSENFEDHVFLDNDPWIIGIESKVKLSALERTYEQVKDRIKVGLINEKDFTAYLHQQV